MIELLFIVLTILFFGFFAGSSISFVTSGRLKLEIESRKNTWTGRLLNTFVNRPECYLTTSLVGTVIGTVIFATLLHLFGQQTFENYYQSWVGSFPSIFAIILLLTIAGSFLLVLFGQFVPQTLFNIHAERWVKVFVLPQQFFRWIFTPISFLATQSSYLFAGIGSSEEGGSNQEQGAIFKQLLDTHGRDIDEEDSEMLNNVLELSNKRVKESMIPRTDILAVEESMSIEETLQLFISSGYSKLPVYRESIDDIIGVMFAYDLFNDPDSLTEIIRPIKLVPVSQKSKDLLSEFRDSNISVAIVIDEYGGTAGMITIEDLLEEVVGDIQDEYDTENHFVKKLSDDTYIMSAGIETEDLVGKYPEINLPEDSGDFETVAGYIINALGRIPKVNEELVINGYKIIISKATSSRIERVKIVVLD
ncbi:hemolysin family protein [Fodinibius salinus]|nr:hemolysin family protein [Fodinibius salinus]